MRSRKKLRFETKVYLTMLFASVLILLSNHKDAIAYVILFLLLIQIIFSIKNKTFWEVALSKEQIEKIRELLFEKNTNKEIINIMNLDVNEQVVEKIRVETFKNDNP